MRLHDCCTGHRVITKSTRGGADMPVITVSYKRTSGRHVQFVFACDLLTSLHESCVRRVDNPESTHEYVKNYDWNVCGVVVINVFLHF